MTASDRPPVRIGARLRAARLARGLTLEKVAGAVGLTKGYVSRLERDEVSPSVASLVHVCQVVGLPVGDLFSPPRTAVVRAGEGVPVNIGGHDVRETVLSGGFQQQLRVLHSHIAPGGTGGAEQYTLDCDVELVYVIRGRLVVVVGETTETLATGDAMTFSGRDPHTWRNGSAEESCEVLWVLSPAP